MLGSGHDPKYAQESRQYCILATAGSTYCLPHPKMGLAHAALHTAIGLLQ